MKKKVILFVCDVSDNTFVGPATKKLQEAGYTVITDVSTMSLNANLDSTCILIALVQMPSHDFENGTQRAILAIAQKYDIPLFGIKHNERELTSEKFWERNGIPTLYYDDFVLPFVTARTLQREIENNCREEDVVIAGYSSATLQ